MCHRSPERRRNLGTSDSDYAHSILGLHLRFFRTLLSCEWGETEFEPGFKWTVRTRDWDYEALFMLMNILHHQTRVVPRIAAIETLAKVTVLVDNYDCYKAVEPWVETWISNLG
jgi:hypothetical protein